MKDQPGSRSHDTNANGEAGAAAGRVLLICLANWSFGEMTLGLRLLEHAKLEAAHLVVAPFMAPMVRHHGMSFTTLIPGRAPEINKLIFLSAYEDFAPDEIVLSDPLTFLESGTYYGLDPQFLSSLGVKVSGLDIYALSCVTQRSLPRGLIFEDYERYMRDVLCKFYVPCPLFDPRSLPPGSTGTKVFGYPSLPALAQPDAPRPERRRPGDGVLRIVVTCAAWEDKIPLDPRLRSIQRCIRQYMFDVLAALSRQMPVHVDVIGMADLQDYASTRALSYEFHATVSPAEFRAIVERADLYLSSNITASSISTSLMLDTPVVCVQNSEDFTLRLEPEGVDVVVPPVLVSPIGWFHFLQPMLEQSRYARSIGRLELSSPIEQAVGYILDRIESRSWKAMTEEYIQEIRALPPVVLGARS